MGKVKSLRVRNLRSFDATCPFVPIDKINLLVGKNSSGKSTFARVFPLMKQSVKSGTKGPVLWFGDYVDFGDFKSAYNTSAQSSVKEISFDFDATVDVEQCDLDSYFRFERAVRGIISDKRVSYNLDVSVCVTEFEQRTVTSRVAIKVGEVFVEIRFSEGLPENISAWLSDGSYSVDFEAEYYAFNSDFIPVVQEKVEIAKNKKNVKGYTYTADLEVVKNRFVEFLEGFHHKSKSHELIYDAVVSIEPGPKEAVFHQLQRVFRDNKQFFKNIDGHEDYVSDVAFLYSVCLNLNKIVISINEELAECFSGVRYLGPVRATAERFYRYQDLQVQEIDHTGANLPMLINSLPVSEKEKMKAWMIKNFSFCFEEQNIGSHYALLIKEEGEEEPHNISDMGFGYSQVLPIIISIWLECYGNEGIDAPFRSISSSIVVIEQPELHLHPVLQYKFASAIANLAKDNNKISFVFETHSDHIIDGLGDAIREGGLDKESVSITLFEKEVGGSSKVSLTSFDDEGYLESWPAGFLSA